MATADLIPELVPRVRFNGLLAAALLVSAAGHGLGVYAAGRWGGCECFAPYVVCPRDCPDVAERSIEIALSEPPPPPAPREPQPEPEPSVAVERPRPERAPAAPAAGRVVLPDEAFQRETRPPADITLDRPALPEEVVVRESEAEAPVIATGEIFGRARDLTAGEPGVFGLGGAGTATGLGPFGADREGRGAAQPAPPAPVSRPEPRPQPEPQPRGPTRNPQVVNWREPAYPEQARQQGIEGTVILRLTVAADGTPRDIEVARSSGHSALDSAAVTHLQRTRFLPALRDGEPVDMAITFRVRFRLVTA